MIKKILFLILIIFIFNQHSNANSLSLKLDNNKYIINKIFFIPITITIPQNSYIYGNPVGPGVGKATEIKIKSKNFIEKNTPLIEQPEKYYPSNDINWVWRYTEKLSVYIPVTIKKNINSKLEFTINLKALLCSNNSCVPININKKFNLFKTASNLEVITKIPDNIVKLGNEISTNNNQKIKIPYNFSPVIINDNNITNIIQAILFGILSGFILNFMPCVLPVLSLKLMSIVKQKDTERKKTILSSLFYSLGVFITFLILASLAAFAGKNWGSLFQSSTFLLIMIIIIFALSLSMFGIYNILTPKIVNSLGSKKNINTYIDSLSKGLLATLLATPCSGPFLGSTLTWALSQPVYIIYAIFISIGFGMSLPFLLIGFFPKLITFIPKPGEWMITLERIMGFFLFGTIIYLVMILPANLIYKTLWSLFILSFGLWIYGKYGNITQTFKRKILSRIFLLTTAVIALLVLFYNKPNTNKNYTNKENKFSIEKLTENKNLNRISIVKFTADWCPNCIIVEKGVIESEEISELISNKSNKIDLLTADITNPNPEAEALLNKLNSISIPFIAVFPPGEQFYKPYSLRDIYTIEGLSTAIKKALEDAKKAEKNFQLEKIEFNR